MQSIDRRQVAELLSARGDTVLIETLPEESFREFHLPGAVNIPVNDQRFDRMAREAAPDKDAPVIVYCQDEACDASTRAAEHLERLGYAEVYEYSAGKNDWKSAGNPVVR